ncbi:MAG: response regulator [Sedimentibacter sp.]
MIKIAAVDDEKHVLERFERIVLGMDGLELCGLFETSEQLLSYLKEQPLDAVFLDIEMPGLNGIQLSEQILAINENIDIIFVTAFNQYAVEAFELYAMDYIMKPLTEDRLSKTLKRLLKSKSKVMLPEKPFIQCFGDFEIFVNGVALTWKNSKAKELLAFLVHKRGVPVDWEKIADAIWPEFDRQKSQTNFHATTYLLRKRLAEAGLTEILDGRRGNYRIVKDTFSCDVYQMEEMINGNNINKDEDFHIFEKLNKLGYMEGNGYAWAYPRAVEIEKIWEIAEKGFNKNK